MPHPRFVDLLAIQHAYERVRIRMRNVAERIRADESVDVGEHGYWRGYWLLAIGYWLLDGTLKLPGGKTRAAFFQRMALISSGRSPITSSARSLAKPVSMVRSVPQSRRSGPSTARASSSMPRSTPLPDRSATML